ncbi:hypothetical protein D3C80_710910 [compost metagenome]
MAQNGVLIRQQFGLYEQVAERRVGQIIAGRCQHHFCIAGDFDSARLLAAVDQRYAAQLNIIFRRYHHLRFHRQRPLLTLELGPGVVEHGAVPLGGTTDRLPGIAPDLTGLRVAQVTESAPVIAGGVFAPAGQGQILPAAVAAAGLGEHQVIVGVGQQLHFGDRGVHTVELACGEAGRGDSPLVGFEMATGAVQLDCIRHPFLQQQPR